MALPIIERDGYECVVIPLPMRMHSCGVPPRFAEVTWASWDPSVLEQIDDEVARKKLTTTLESLRTWNSKSPVKTIVLSSLPGRGKTTLAAATMARVVATPDTSAHWVDWPSLVATVADSWKEGGERAILGPLSRVPFLVIDDFAKGQQSSGEERMAQLRDWQVRVAYELLNPRYTAKLPTVITTELSGAGMAKAVDQALVSRLMEDGRWIDLSSLPDLRVRRTS